MMEARFVTSDRGRTAYWVSRPENAGTPTLVLLHGLTADHRLFDKQAEAFAQRYSLIVWDAPGHGQSRPYADISYAHMAQALCAILDAEGVARAVLIGQSMGGFAAQAFIRRFPERAMGFVSIDNCPLDAQYYSRLDLFWLRQVEWMARCFPDGLLRRAMAGACGATAYARAHMLEMLRGYNKRELCRLMGAGYTEFILELHAQEIPCPVCLILGQYDFIGLVAQYNRRWHALAGYPLHVIPRAAHNANEDHPAAVNDVIADFIRGLQA